MKIKALLVSVVAAAAVTAGMSAPAHADDPITVTAQDIDVTSNTCFYQSIRITGMTTPQFPYVVQINDPSGNYLTGGTWIGNAQFDYVNGFCSSLAEGHYSIVVENVTYGGFDVYRPHLDIAAAGARFKGKRHVVSAVLSIHGKRMGNTPVKVRKHVSGKRGTQTVNRTTDAAGRVRAVCTKGHRCTVRFDYGNGFTLSRVVRLGHR